MKQKYKIITIKFEDNDYEYVFAKAKEKRLNISTYIRVLLGEYLDGIEI